jgi:predicted nucleotidyltransferase
MKSLITKLVKDTKKIPKSILVEIDDIVLFGSTLKGKDNPKDIDILIIFKKKVNKEFEYNLKQIYNLNKIQIESITLNEFYTENYIAKEGIFLEGYSLLHNKKINTLYGFNSIAFIKYDIQRLKGSARIKFYYALQGRNKNEGILKKLNAKRFSNNVIIIKYSRIEIIKEFFEYWKLDYKIIPTLIPQRLKLNHL